MLRVQGYYLNSCKKKVIYYGTHILLDQRVNLKRQIKQNKHVKRKEKKKEDTVVSSTTHDLL